MYILKRAADCIYGYILNERYTFAFVYPEFGYTTNTKYTQLLYHIFVHIRYTEMLQPSHMRVKVGLSVLKIFSYIYALYQTVHYFVHAVRKDWFSLLKM